MAFLPLLFGRDLMLQQCQIQVANFDELASGYHKQHDGNTNYTLPPSYPVNSTPVLLEGYHLPPYYFSAVTLFRDTFRKNKTPKKKEEHCYNKEFN